MGCNFLVCEAMQETVFVLEQYKLENYKTEEKTYVYV